MQNLNDILRSQQLLNTVNDDIRRLKLVHKVWLEMIENTVKNEGENTFNPQILEQCLPVSIRKQTLNIGCESSLTANHIRFIEKSLLQEFFNNGLQGITSLNISVMPKEFQQNNRQTRQLCHRDVDQRTINTLNDFTRSCSSEKLRSSTERLIKQLQKNTKSAI